MENKTTKTYYLKNNIQVSFLSSGEMSEIQFLDELSNFNDLIKNDDSRSIIYFLFSTKMNYTNNISRSLEICAGSTKNILNKLIINNLVNIVDINDDSISNKTFYLFVENVLKTRITKTMKFYKLTDWAFKFVQDNKNYFINKIDSNTFNAIEYYHKSIKEISEKIRQERADYENLVLEKQREAEVEAEAKKIKTDDDFFFALNDGRLSTCSLGQIGHIRLLESQCNMYNKQFGFNVKEFEFLKKVEAFKTKVKNSPKLLAIFESKQVQHQFMTSSGEFR